MVQLLDGALTMPHRYLVTGIITVSAFFTYLPDACAQTLSSLQAWYSFDQDNTSLVPDASGHANQGVLIGNFGRRRGVIAKALEFRGRDYMDAGPQPGISTQMTLSAFLWVDHAGDPMWIASKGMESRSFWGIQLLENGTLRFSATWRDSFTRQGKWESTRRVTANQWTHIAVSYDGARVVFYIDGQADPVNAQFAFNQGTVRDEALLLGANYPGAEAYFDGLIDEVRLYSRALSQNEIQDLIVVDSRAEAPDPAHGDQRVQTPVLSWRPSSRTVQQRLYLGEDPGALAQVSGLVPVQPISHYRHGLGFTPGQTYYWRVDSVDAQARVSPGDLWSFTTLGLGAEDPEPAHGAHFVPTQVLLGWTPGVFSSRYHNVYFGTDQVAVENADETWPQFRGQFPATDFLFNPGELEPGTSYFWRIDGIGFGNTLYRGDLWHFSTQSAASAIDPDLGLWWKFDEGSGDTAADASGMNRHGQIHNGNWVHGRWGQGIEFDSRSTYIAISNAAVVQSSDLTLSTWIYPYSQTHERVIAWWNARGIWLTDERIVISWDGQHGSIVTGDITDEWTHVALSVRGNSQRNAYINGGRRSLIPDGVHFPRSVMQSGLTLGNTDPVWGGYFFDGIMDDVRIYRRALDASDIPELVAGDALMASQPEPAYGAEMSHRLGQLTWQQGSLARSHDVYLGEDRRAVEMGTLSSYSYLGRYPSTQANLHAALRAGRTYYWRVDEVQENDAIVQGLTWQFTTAGINTIDDFETYSAFAPGLIFETWIDGLGFEGVSGNGTGSYVGHDPGIPHETERVHGGRQSMPLYYDNTTGALYSEANRSFSQAQDWLGSGMKSLVLYYWGDPVNGLGPQDRLYVAVRDAQGREAVLPCNHRASLLQRARWHQWKISRDQLSGTGLNLRAINRLSIGVGNRTHPLAGNSGMIIIDDIRLSSLGLSSE